MLNISNLQKAIACFPDLNVLVIGDVMLDEYIIGQVDRMSPEAPVPVLTIKETEFRLGGAANVALNIKKLGANALLHSVIGTDIEGDQLINCMQNNAIPVTRLIRDQHRQTTLKTRICGKEGQLMRIDKEQTNPISIELRKTLVDSISDSISNSKIDIILFQDYDKGVISPELIKQVVQRAKKNQIFIAADPKFNNFNHYHDINLFKPNLKEFEKGANKRIDVSNMDKHSTIFDNLHKKNRICTIMLTLSEEGIFISTSSMKSKFAVTKVGVADVSGAGDTVLSVASLLMASGISPDETAVVANIAGGIVCGRNGVSPISGSELIKEIASNNISRT